MANDDREDEVGIKLGDATLEVPKKDIVEKDSPEEPRFKVDPVALFEFLAGYNKYPTNGLKLAEAAEKKGYSQKLVKFFEGVPGTIESESDIMPYAELASKPPYI